MTLDLKAVKAYPEYVKQQLVELKVTEQFGELNLSEMYKKGYFLNVDEFSTFWKKSV